MVVPLKTLKTMDFGIPGFWLLFSYSLKKRGSTSGSLHKRVSQGARQTTAQRNQPKKGAQTVKPTKPSPPQKKKHNTLVLEKLGHKLSRECPRSHETLPRVGSAPREVYLLKLSFHVGQKLRYLFGDCYHPKLVYSWICLRNPQKIKNIPQKVP